MFTMDGNDRSDKKSNSIIIRMVMAITAMYSI
jgi:hypothetical protein